MKANKKAHGAQKRAAANVPKAKVETSKDGLSKLMAVGSELAKEIHETKRSWVPRQDRDNDKEKNKDQKGEGRWKKNADVVNDVTADENTPTNDAP